MTRTFVPFGLLAAASFLAWDAYQRRGQLAYASRVLADPSRTQDEKNLVTAQSASVRNRMFFDVGVTAALGIGAYIVWRGR